MRLTTTPHALWVNTAMSFGLSQSIQTNLGGCTIVRSDTSTQVPWAKGEICADARRVAGRVVDNADGLSGIRAPHSQESLRTPIGAISIAVRSPSLLGSLQAR